MADPWDGLDDDVEVLDKAPETAATPPWAGLGDDVQVDDQMPDNMVTGRVADETEAYLSRAKLKYTPTSTKTWRGWTAQVGRAASFGLADFGIAAKLYMTAENLPKGTSYTDVLAAVRAGEESAEKSTSAEIVGSLAGAPALVAGGALRLGGMAASAASRAGLVQGALRWAGRHPVLARVGAASGIGAGVGLTEEAVRSSINESLDTSMGHDWDVGDVTGAALNGAVVGALMTPVMNEGLRGMSKWVQSAITSGDEKRALTVQRHMLKVLANKGEEPEAVLARIRNDAIAYTQEHGAPPALADIVGHTRARELAEVTRFHTGLGEKAEEMGDALINQRLRDFDAVVKAGAPLQDTAVIEGQMEDLFSDVMRRYGNQPVHLTDDAFNVLSENKDFLVKQKHNAEARKILDVVEARESVDKMRGRLSKLADASTVADSKADVESLADELAELINQEIMSSDVEMSEIGKLRAMVNRMRAAHNALSADISAEQKVAALAAFKPTVAHIERTLADFSQNGIVMPLKSVNAMRINASKMANDARNSGVDPLTQGVYRNIRDSIANIGVKEVPIYKETVKGWHRAMTVSEAQDLGAKAVKGGVSTQNLGEALSRGRVPGKPRAAEASDVRKGADLGARIALSRGANQGENAGVRTVQNLAASREAQANLRLITPAQGDKIIAAAERVQKSIRGLRGAQGKSPTVLDKDFDAMADAMTALQAGTLGGAAKAGLAARIWKRFRVPRKVSEGIVDALFDPAQTKKVLSVVARRGIDLKEFMSVVVAATTGESE